jgi:nitroreductase
VELARFAPNGGNRCPVRFVFVRDPALRRQLATLWGDDCEA